MTELVGAIKSSYGVIINIQSSSGGVSVAS